MVVELLKPRPLVPLMKDVIRKLRGKKKMKLPIKKKYFDDIKNGKKLLWLAKDYVVKPYVKYRMKFI